MYQPFQIGNRTLEWLDSAIAKVGGRKPFFAFVGPYATAFDNVALPKTPNYNHIDELGGGTSESSSQ